MYNFFSRLKEKIFSSRMNVVFAVMVMFSIILILRLFILQIVKGQDYQNNYDLRIEKQKTIEATRGNIYDRNGQLIAYNKLAYAVTIEDSGSYKSDGTLSANQVKNRDINANLAKVITKLEENKDTISNDFGIFINGSGEYEFTSSGTSLQRFRADIFGHASINDLKYNSKLKLDEANATADEIMDYLQGDRKFQVSDEYDKELRYKITVVRYNMSLKSYQKYLSTTIAKNVSNETVAYIKENSADFTGIDIEETSVRVYDDAEAFSSIIGYTGTISTEEYNELSKTDETVSKTDQVGKAGIEQYMNGFLTGKKGSETIYVDSLGNPIMTTNHVDAESGNDLYMSIDKNLQIRTYHILEQELAGIILARMTNSKSSNSSVGSASSYDTIPVYDAYINLITNHVLDTSEFNSDDATSLEKSVYNTYVSHKQTSLNNLNSYFTSNPVVYSSLPQEYQEMMTYIVKKLKSDDIFDSSLIDSDDDMQVQWTSESLSVNDYLKYALKQNWIDVTKISSANKYLDTDEAYDALIAYIMSSLQADTGFDGYVYKHAILNDEISPNSVCALLYDQGVLEEDQATRDGLVDGSVNVYSFITDKIKNLQITPGQLGLDPCSASSVVIDPNTGAVLASVSYPGYDSNILSNGSDPSYFAYLNVNSSRPLYNYATQQKTAPGSTFKPLTSAAGLAENVITPETQITDGGQFDKVSNHPKCSVYPRTHGTINVSEALRDSCNYFYYEVGYRLASAGGSYDDATGINTLQKYAGMFGLDSTTGVEVSEATSTVATEYPVMAAIGQSNNNMTTIALARYASAISNQGTVYNLTLLDHVQSKDGEILEQYGPTVKNSIDVLNQAEWDSIHSGMRMVVENLSNFDGFTIPVAGKTGTAQSSTSRASHALFICYAPYESPQIAVATRIAYGYSSHYAADASRYIVGSYFEDQATLDAINGQALSVNKASSND